MQVFEAGFRVRCRSKCVPERCAKSRIDRVAECRIIAISKSLKLASPLTHHLFGFAENCFARFIDVGVNEAHAKREVLETKLVHLTAHPKFQDFDFEAQILKNWDSNII